MACGSRVATCILGRGKNVGLKDVVKLTTGEKPVRREGTTAEDLEEAVMNHYNSYNRKNFPKKTQGFHPSWFATGHGDCERHWYYAFNGTKASERHDPRLVAIFHNGHSFHDRMQKHLEDMGILVEAEIPVTWEDPPLEGHSDGEIHWRGLRALIELKSISAEGFFYRVNHKKPKEAHVEQLLFYMYCLGIDHGYVCYESKNTQEIKFFHIEMTPEHKKYVEDKFGWMRELYEAIEQGVKPKRGHRKNSRACKECPFYDACYEDKDKGEDLGLPKYANVGELP